MIYDAKDRRPPKPLRVFVEVPCVTYVNTDTHEVRYKIHNENRPYLEERVIIGRTIILEPIE